MTKRRSSSDVAALRRKLSRKLGPRAQGKLVAIDCKTGTYVVEDDLDTLLSAISHIQTRTRSRDLLIFRLGQRAAIELRWRR
jgi:hypothetical protein